MKLGTANSMHRLDGAVVALRSDLVISPYKSGSDSHYLIEDPVRSRYFRIGKSEYDFVTQIDGQSTVQEVISRQRSHSEEKAAEFNHLAVVDWLLKMDLARVVNLSPSVPVYAATAKPNVAPLSQWNPLSFRIPLLHPDEAFGAIARSTGWLFGPAACAAWVVLNLVALYLITAGWIRFQTSLATVLAPDNWFSLAACWLVLKIVHESAHGIAAKRFGATVREMGIQFNLLMPLAYVDLTSIWKIPSSRQRMCVAAAGMYSEIMVASFATILWSTLLADGPLAALCCNLIVMASLTTVLFNANPLMRLDGYCVLSELLALPNLYSNGQRLLRDFARKYLFGLATATNWITSREKHVTLVYGICALLWRVTLSITLVVGAITMFHGAGLILAITAAIAWFGLPLIRFACYLAVGNPVEQPSRIHFLSVTCALGTSLTLLLAFVPWPGSISAHAIVEFDSEAVLRASSSGFLKEIHVIDGAAVSPGQLIAVLQNDELACQLAQLELEIQQCEVRSRQHEQHRRFADVQAENERRASLRTQRDELREQIEKLRIRAPITGTILSNRLGIKLGTYFEAGDEIARIGNEHHKRIRYYVSESMLNAFDSHDPKTAWLAFAGQTTMSIDIDRLDPRGSKGISAPALSAENGGPLAVKPVAEERSDKNEHSYEFVQTQFTGVAQLPAESSQSLHVGQRGTISRRPLQTTIGRHTWLALSQWLETHVRPAVP